MIYENPYQAEVSPRNVQGRQMT